MQAMPSHPNDDLLAFIIQQQVCMSRTRCQMVDKINIFMSLGRRREFSTFSCPVEKLLNLIILSTRLMNGTIMGNVSQHDSRASADWHAAHSQ